MTPQECIFCRIVAGHEPATITRRWPHAVAFTPLNPVTEGHTLIVPTTHVRDAREDPNISATAMAAAAQYAADVGPCNIITSAGPEATQTVFHLHLHVVPRADGDGLTLPWTPPAPASVFLAYGGEYDARDVRKVFARKDDADTYGCADYVVEQPVQRGPVETRPWHRVWWPINDPAAPAEVFDMVNPFDHICQGDPRDYDGRADALDIEWWPGVPPHAPWMVQFTGWDLDLIRAAWKERRDRIVAAAGELQLPIDSDPDETAE
ncbi:HIT family protein [Nonomuraea fuscirosea]|uniref:HIT family protein n=1 Tax=Nonomuraea fuscirosea TaxID=1291556 RepID=UPI0037179831